MTDPKKKLSVAEVSAAGLSDWRQLTVSLRARFATGDFTTGLNLVNEIGAAAEEANHHPEVSLSYPEVRVVLSSHDVGGITSRDLDLARTISELAAAAGVTSTPNNQTLVELGMDTNQPDGLSPFYAALFAAEVSDGEIVDASGQAPTIWFQSESAAGTALPDTTDGHQQRWHLDVWVPIDEAPQRVQAVLDAGGRLVSDASAPSFWVVEDAQENRSCVCSVAER